MRDSTSRTGTDPTGTMFPDRHPLRRTLCAMDVVQLLVFAVIGVLAGSVGGLLGIGGSTIFIPAATLFFGEDQQAYQAAAMILNAFVAITATIKHSRNGLLRKRLVIPMGIAASLLVLLGVALSNHLESATLAQLFGVLLLVIAANEVRLLVRGRPSEDPASEKVDGGGINRSPVLLPIGAAMGFMGGLLGIGGGTIGVPLLKVAGRLPLRLSIANAAAVTVPLAIIGAVYKNLTLPTLPGYVDGTATHVMMIAAALIPGAIIGSWLGAELVHRLPLLAIRIAFLCLLLFAGTRMLGLH